MPTATPRPPLLTKMQQPPPPQPPRPPSSPRAASPFNTSVQETCMEALNGKASCVTKRYYQDRFLRLFRPSYPPPPAMSPLISRGYFTRVRALELIVQAFERHVLEAATAPPRVNLVLLGAGLDTLFFRLMDEEEEEANEGGVTRCYYEVDFAPVVQYKAACIRADKELCQVLDVVAGDATTPDASLSFPSVVLASHAQGTGRRYALVAGDLADTAALEATLAHAGMDWSLPTLLIAECVLVYMEAAASQRLVEWAAQKFPVSAWVSYDMIKPYDAFGRMMRNNLKSRGLQLPGFEAFGQSLEAQLARFVGAGEKEGAGEGEGEESGPWQRAVGGDMNAVYDAWLLPADREKAARLEHLDEMEEWHMLMGHYCYVVATQGRALDTLLHGVPGFVEQRGRTT